MNNIFFYSPKELTTDAFLAWVFLEFNHNKDFKKYTSTFFYKLGISEDTKHKISDISVKTQDKNTDLTVSYSVNGSAYSALFENKTYSTIHSDQLDKYRDSFPDCNYYKYMKLAFIYHSEECLVKNAGYDVINVYTLYNAIKSIKVSHYLLDQYKQFLQQRYIKIQDNIKTSFIKNNEYESFYKREYQQYFLSILHKSIDRLNKNIVFKSSANSGGTPWTQLRLAKRDKAYGATPEYIFWRIDKRSSRYYLRLNQYAHIDNKYKNQKINNRDIIRKSLIKLFYKHKLTLGNVSNKGIFESEIAIVYFDNNELKLISKVLPQLSRDICKRYASIKKLA